MQKWLDRTKPSWYCLWRKSNTVLISIEVNMEDSLYFQGSWRAKYFRLDENVRVCTYWIFSNRNDHVTTHPAWCGWMLASRRVVVVISKLPSQLREYFNKITHIYFRLCGVAFVGVFILVFLLINVRPGRGTALQTI